MLPSQEVDRASNENPQFLAIGKLRRPHGVRGEILMDVLTDFPERIHVGKRLYVGNDHQVTKLKSMRWADKSMIVSFEGYPDRETVGVLRNQIVFIPNSDLPPLPEGDYYHHQLIGKEVVTDDGRSLGKLTQIIETGANDVGIVQPEIGSEILLPLIDDVLLDIDEDAGIVRVHLLDGLLNED